VNIGQLEKAFDSGAEVDAAAIRQARLVNARQGPIKVLGGGELTKKLTVKADRFSASARQKIEGAGGTVVTA
jgi:large subunit ribosomal protein L15